MKNLFPLHPNQEARILEWMCGPQNGEDPNVFCARMNKVITDNDRQWVIDFYDRHHAAVRKGTAARIRGHMYPADIEVKK